MRGFFPTCSPKEIRSFTGHTIRLQVYAPKCSWVKSSWSTCATSASKNSKQTTPNYPHDILIHGFPESPRSEYNLLSDANTVTSGHTSYPRSHMPGRLQILSTRFLYFIGDFLALKALCPCIPFKPQLMEKWVPSQPKRINWV